VFTPSPGADRELILMATWQEIPAHRILVVDRAEVHRDFDLIGENGEEIDLPEDCMPPSLVPMVRRRSDGKLFRWAEWVPATMSVRSQVALREA
jgi:hypothetical protein